MRVGVEVGGTFTDLVAVDGGRVLIAKVPSTPARPDEGALAALEAAGIAAGAVTDLVHGSTVATNAILERTGAAIALVVTRGFRDILLLQRHNRKRIYDLFYRKPAPVVGRGATFEVRERMGADGIAIEPLDEVAAARVAERIGADRRYQAVAVCLLNAYANPAHERRLAEMMRARRPDLPVTCSSDVTREFREYERASTTSLAAYVQPVIDSYLSRLSRALGERGFRGRFSVMQSNGGRLPAEGMARNAITALFSGPAAGVTGAVSQAARSGFGHVITLDMGGTSTDVCLVSDGTPALRAETEVDGLPIRIPVLDIVSVGAGGGSIVWVDDGGLLRVGPRSAGADPGPACYARGGQDPTVTDAHLVRGTIQPEAFLGGRMHVDGEASRRALAPLAERFGMTVREIADAAARVAEASIVRAIQVVSTERGRDPRDHVLVPFGGAGPLHAARVAEDLGIHTICVPPNAGVLSAYGLLAADHVQYETWTRRVPVDEAAPATVRAVFGEMESALRATLARLGIEGPLAFTYGLDMRFVGQAFEVPVPLGSAAVAGLTADGVLDRFREAHHQVFEFGESGDDRAEIVSFRVGASAPAGELPALAEAGEVRAPGRVVTIFERGAETECRLLVRTAFPVGEPVPGPILVDDATATIYIPHGWHGERDRHHSLLLRRATA
ncbi:MAG TPA: hydantoinase/oxoprolinase family protein [Candidatus Binatia bacterium]|nr:hydantoinase/oxoprolinase family protein [Candidatus Binatia bacterium]